MEYLYIKSLHIIFVVTWFAGLFYMVRLFIYHKEAEDKEETARYILQQQYKLMEKRLWYIITWPSAIITALTAGYLLYLSPGFLTQSWMWVKLAFVAALFIYQILCHKIFKQLQNNVCKYSTMQLRLWNEVATIILFAVVFLVVLKNAITWVWGVIGILLVSVILMLMVKVYKKLRAKKSWDENDKN
ncbi:putative membrane protein [Wenyingzhuangia heitensis]|uniref:Protoporphyrinogen IX oxidase n=1 Tax=Wenyingzhuangia heitensis TaxID=1487859 RepID=A0ABX0UDY0_9FLAO|nr:CopD family protein [Wenyingzhuangia heitensis]NIJ45391.1 putative membrane protein [Wenyingzhuangia heitensis]